MIYTLPEHQRPSEWPTSLKNLVSAYGIVNKLQLVVPPGVTAADYRVTSDNLLVDVAWLGQWFDYRTTDRKTVCCFVNAANVHTAKKACRSHGPNTQTVQFLAELIISDSEIIKCRYEILTDANSKLVATWDTYCYFVETGQLDMLVTAHLLGYNERRPEYEII